MRYSKSNVSKLKIYGKKLIVKKFLSNLNKSLTVSKSIKTSLTR